MSWLAVIDELDKSAPLATLLQAAEIYNIPHSFLSYSELLSAIGDYRSRTKGLSLGVFLNPYDPLSRHAEEAWEWFRGVREYDPTLPVRYPTNESYRVYTPLLLYRLCRRKGLSLTSSTGVRGMIKLLTEPSELGDNSAASPQPKVDTNEGGEVSPAHDTPLSPPIKDTPPSPIVVVPPSETEPSSKVESSPIDERTLPALGSHLEGNTHDSLGRAISAHSLHWYEEGWYNFNEDELTFLFARDEKVYNPHTMRRLSPDQVRHLLGVVKGTKLEQIVRENRDECVVLRRYLVRVVDPMVAAMSEEERHELRRWLLELDSAPSRFDTLKAIEYADEEYYLLNETIGEVRDRDVVRSSKRYYLLDIFQA
jgi:hypothetical protein